ncbi:MULTISPECIES: hypothetical protein [unclassified Mesorhizobium]|uniref:hypothetical protein n=1 Tax=unclassified Mesorhizobium TaxID=325217 RepID=UPI000FDC68F5|nr:MULTISPECIES: hypothetical protein [unclassified Mesorhizobium]TGT76726.1 hypothetical protein EN809_003740 [Mesorhizobium sp. M2E.F.Ca.ET.166.01.1.1]TGW02838.1 hypothetical protein EN797_003740 [Mesorhizobium sp. M2E.F.Ca.ET.154.01.1.1]
MALRIVTFRWGDKYGPEYVNKLWAGVERNLTTEHTFNVLHPLPEDEYLTKEKGCFARLRLFDPKYQAQVGFKPGDRIVCMDLDLIVTGPLDELFDRAEPFTILQGVNSANPCPFNGSLWILEAGYRPDVWGEFSLELAAKVPYHEFPDDQAWLADMLPDAGSFGPEDGVYAFQKKGWPKGESLPRNAKLVCFPGWRDPSQYTRLDWVQQHWRS